MECIGLSAYVECFAFFLFIFYEVYFSDYIYEPNQPATCAWISVLIHFDFKHLPGATFTLFSFVFLIFFFYIFDNAKIFYFFSSPLYTKYFYLLFILFPFVVLSFAPYANFKWRQFIFVVFISKNKQQESSSQLKSIFLSIDHFLPKETS